MIQLFIRGEVVTVRNGEASCPTNHDVEREVRALGGIATAESPIDHAERLARELGGEVVSIGDEERAASNPPLPIPEPEAKPVQASSKKQSAAKADE